MSDRSSDTLQASLLRQRALARWDNEGGAGPEGPQTELPEAGDQDRAPQTDGAGLVALPVRVIAVQSVMVALRAGGLEGQVAPARSMEKTVGLRHVAPSDVRVTTQ